ncbi:MAG: helix-turn-helix transcriptional regulator [Clostridia bacterium]|nr:helix-turn-helix transcriptional regulator [Clostridia bacterium]
MEQIGSILKRLRTERGFTQTEVAAAISVTSQAVSKWENGSGMPDVSQLVPLADFFGVTVDCILGRRDNAAEEEIAEYIAKFDDIVCFGRDLAKEQGISVEEAFDILIEEARKMCRKYPGNYRLMAHLSWVLYFAPKEGGYDGNQKACELYGELVDLEERILAECPDSKLRNDAVIIMVWTYPYLNRYDRIKALAEQSMPMHGCREALLCDAAEHGTEEHRKYNEEYLHHCIKHIHYALWGWYFRKDCPPEECLALADMEWKIYHAYHDRGDFDKWETGHLFENRLYAARAYLAMNNEAAADRAIQDGLDLLAAVMPDEAEVYTSTAMTRVDRRVPWHRYPEPDWVRDMAKSFTKDTGVDITDRIEGVLVTSC